MHLKESPTTEELPILTLRKVGPEDWEKFRDIRLEALKRDPQAFAASSYDYESSFGELEWKERLDGSSRCFFVAESKDVEGKDILLQRWD